MKRWIADHKARLWNLPYEEETPEVKKRDIYEILCWGVILVTAMAMAVLGSTENLWYDEAYTVAMIQHPVREIVEITY